ncbi:MAG: GIY-YIG nuclease family protein [Clostridia bacterium]|nr:GIY-YIG nuclease family protein [Clostridia bacterium]
MIAKQTEVRMYYVYILASKANAMLYIGVTNDLRHRLREHREGLFEGYTKTYDIHKLVFFEEFSNINDAIACEKRLKRWTRAKKNALVESKNPNWDDWSEGFI